MEPEIPDEPESSNERPTWDPTTDDLFVEYGVSPTPLDYARDDANMVISFALEEVMNLTRAQRERVSWCWWFLWLPLDAERKLTPYPTDPFQLRRWPALIHDIRRHVKRALAPHRRSGDAWPPSSHPIWQEGLGLLCSRRDVMRLAPGLASMPPDEFARKVKHAWEVGPRIETTQHDTVPYSVDDGYFLAFPAVSKSDGTACLWAVKHWSVIRLKSKAELAARQTLRSKLGVLLWRKLTFLALAEFSPAQAQVLAAELDTRRLSSAMKEALAKARLAKPSSVSAARLQWNLTAAERSALRQLVDDVSHYGRITPFVEEFLIRDTKPGKLRPRPDHPIRQHPVLQQAVRRAFELLAAHSPDPLGELVELLLHRIPHRVVWETQDWDQAKDEDDRRAAKLRLREMLRRQLQAAK